jgi:hypothetical protein
LALKSDNTPSAAPGRLASFRSGTNNRRETSAQTPHRAHVGGAPPTLPGFHYREFI